MTDEEISVVALVKGGRADDDLNAVIEAVAWRKKVLASRLFDDLAVGDRVRIGSIKPRYLVGAMATVEEKHITKVTIRFDDNINDPYQKWAGNRCLVSPSAIEKVEEV